MPDCYTNLYDEYSSLQRVENNNQQTIQILALKSNEESIHC